MSSTTRQTNHTGTHDEVEVTMEQMNIMLVATDFSEHSKQAWEYALHEAQIHKARLVVVHVILRMVREDRMLMDTMATMRV